MSVLKNRIKGSAPTLGSLVQDLRTHISNQGGDFASADQTNNLISMESLGDAQRASVETHFEDITSQLQGMITSLGLEAFDDKTPEGKRRLNIALEAGAIAAMAAGNPRAYAEAAYGNKAKAADGVVLVDVVSHGAAGAMDYRSQPSLEAFDDRELKEHLPYSIAFNALASRQDDFSEAFYPTTVVTPDQAGLDVSVSRMLVFNEVRHALTGKVADFQKKNLIDAAVDSSILADQSTRLVPHKAADNSNQDKFVPATAVAAYSISVAGVSIPTAPLLMGKEVDLLGLSQYQPLIGAGIIDHTDSVDAKVVLEALYLLPEAGEAAVKFTTARLPRSAFVKSVEGNYREMNLQFSTRDLVIDANTKSVDGAAVDAFSAITAGNYRVFLGVDVNGVLNVETGNVRVGAFNVVVSRIVNNSGADIALDTGAGATIKTALEAMSFIGYDLNANRTNANRRTRGLQLDTTIETERYTIPLGAPISVPSPATSNRDAADLKALITAARIRNSNNAVTALLNYADTLEAYVKGPRLDGPVPQVQGMGRFLVQPWFERHTLDLEQSINSIKSHEKAADISAVLVNAIRDIAYRAYRDSKYQAALDAVSGGTGETPILVVGTDQVLVRHLIVSGDTRTFGTTFEKAVVKSTLDRRMRNKIVLTFVREKSDGPDPLSFGTHAWIPELTSSIMVSRNGGTIKEAMVQPRTLHVNNLPILAVIDVLNLTKVLADKIDTPVTQTAIDNPYLPGIVFP